MGKAENEVRGAVFPVLAMIPFTQGLPIQGLFIPLQPIAFAK